MQNYLKISIFIFFAIITVSIPIAYICCFYNSSEKLVHFPVVQTKFGSVLGRVVDFSLPEWDKADYYYAFQGIPYAKPPVNNLRFQPPEEPDFWNNTRNATEDGNNCVNINGGHEDCLYINVYTPTLEPTVPYSVLVFIHGGKFVEDDVFYNNTRPDFFISEKHVVVTFNYRLNVFGFLNTMNRSATGNVGLKDQIFALRWVQRNIENFGGDSNCVTVFGVSAGAASIQYLLLSPLATGLFHHAIALSGSILCTWALQWNDSKMLAFKLAELLNIKANNTISLIEQLQKVDAMNLFEAAYSMEKEVIPIDADPFEPSYDTNQPGAVIINSNYETLKNGHYANNISYLTGYNNYEGTYTTQLILDGKMNYSMFINDPELLVPLGMNLKKGTTNSINAAKEIIFQYFDNNTENIRNLSYFEKYQTHNMFVRGISKSIELIKENIEVFAWRITYESDSSGNRPKNAKMIRGHGSEMNYLFNYYINESANDMLMRQRIVKLLSNFAKTGHPTPTREDLFNNIIWESAAKTNATIYLNIDKNMSNDYNPDQKDYEFWNQLYAKYWKPPYNVY